MAQVELPLGATEDRICGTINIEKALQEGVKAYEPGLLVSGTSQSARCMMPCFSAAARHSLDAQCYELELWPM